MIFTTFGDTEQRHLDGSNHSSKSREVEHHENQTIPLLCVYALIGLEHQTVLDLTLSA